MAQCRFCTKQTERKHSYDLFNGQCLRGNLPARLSVLLQISVEPSTDLPPFICRTCKSNMQGLEEKLNALRVKASNSYSLLQAHNPLKRTKETSIPEAVSPSIAKALPPSKRIRRGRVLFPDGKIILS